MIRYDHLLQISEILKFIEYEFLYQHVTLTLEFRTFWAPIVCHILKRWSIMENYHNDHLSVYVEPDFSLVRFSFIFFHQIDKSKTDLTVNCV